MSLYYLIQQGCSRLRKNYGEPLLFFFLLFSRSWFLVEAVSFCIFEYGLSTDQAFEIRNKFFNMRLSVIIFLKVIKFLMCD